MKNLPFTVIGGYLGAGKTTLLNHLLTKTIGKRIALLVNDFGSVNIDVGLITSNDGDMVLNLANGCMCCSLVDGFTVAVERIRQRAEQFDHVVIEASGVADPGRVAQYGLACGLHLDGIIILADAERIKAQVDNKYIGDTVVHQLSQGDLIILNKIDLVSSDELASLKHFLTSMAPSISILEAVNGDVPTEMVLGSYNLHHLQGSHVDHDHLFQSWKIEISDPLERRQIENFANNISRDIYRVKGFVYLAEDPTCRYIYQQVGTRFALLSGQNWQEEKPSTLLVAIGRQGAEVKLIIN
jgi:G3E family GTPase